MPAVDQSVGLVAHFPVGQGHCDIVPFDLELGWQAAEMAWQVREMRKAEFVTAFGLPLEQAPSGDRREWLIRRVRWLAENYPDAALTLAARWPDGVPTLKTDGHSPEQLQLIVEAAIFAEAQHKVPFFDEIDPLS